MSLPTHLSARTRTVMRLRRFGVASVPMLGRYNYSKANPGLRNHQHHGAMEICFLVRGRQTYCVADQRFSLRGGDVFMTLPDERHGTGGEPEQKGLLYWITLLDPSTTDGSLLGLPPRESRVLWQTLNRMPRRHFPGTPDMQAHLDAVTRAVHVSWSPISRVIVTNSLVAFLLAVVKARQASLKTTGHRFFQKVFAHIEAHIDEPDELTVEKLAAISRLSPSRFKARFKEEIGIPPAEYALRVRVEEAARRLTDPGVTITDVAYSLGFSSSQYFASVFKRFTNTTPRQARPGKS